MMRGRNDESMKGFASQIESLCARAAVMIILCACAALTALARAVRWLPRLVRGPAPARPRLRIMLVGTFYNDAWFDAHVAPLLQCDLIDTITVVTDRSMRPASRVRYEIPPPRIVRMVGRTLGRAIWTFHCALRHRSDLLMGYHIMPNALVCLIVARLLGRRAAYQMTGGPVQLAGGGVGSENTLLRRQRKPGRFRESLIHHLARQFDLVVVRGTRAADYMRSIH